ncbi:MAG: hypothetical protein AAB660_02720 [Patescibacteria group bacterium]
MRRFTVLLAILFMLLPFNLNAQNVWVESQNMVSSGVAPATQMNVSISKNYSEHFGVFLWSIVSEGWSESIVGGVWLPSSHYEFSLGAGLESNDNPARALGSVFVSYGKSSLYVAGEQGGSGHWFVAQGNYKLSGRIGVGFRGQHNVGLGPRVEFNPTRHFKLWAVPYTLGLGLVPDGKTVFGLRFIL